MSDIVERLRRTRCPEYSASCGIGCACADMMEAADRIESLEAAIKRQASSARAFRASTLASVQHLTEKDRSEYFAAKALDSERAANAALTERVEALEATLEKIADTDPDNGLEWFHAAARKALEATND